MTAGTAVQAFVLPANQIEINRSAAAAALSAQRISFVPTDGFRMDAQLQELATRLEKTKTATSAVVETIPAAMETEAAPETTTSTTTEPNFTPVAPESSSLFQQRNAQIMQAAAAGKSRWGTFEIEKAKVESAYQYAKQALQVFEERQGEMQNTVASGKAPWDAFDAAKTESEALLRKAVEALEVAMQEAPLVEKANGHAVTETTPPAEKEPLVETLSNIKAPFLPLVSGSVIQQRNTQVMRAAEAGKSRWGEAEVNRLVGGPASEPVAKTTGSTEMDPGTDIASNVKAQFLPLVNGSAVEQRNTQVLRAAYAGKSRWGNAEVKRLMEGPVWEPVMEKTESPLTEAVVNGQPSFTPLVYGSLLQQRNAQVLSAAAVGKARWGESEIKRIQEQDTIDESPESLEVFESMSLFEQRGAQILNAAAAGKSRWGDFEIEKVKGQIGLKKAPELL